MDPTLCFKLDVARVKRVFKEYPDTFQQADPKNALKSLVFKRTYSRIKENGKRETFHECILRVVNGTFSLQKEWIQEQGFIWNEAQGQANAEEMLSRMAQLKMLPPGRGLWVMGTPVVHTKGLGIALFNCNFTSTRYINIEHSRPFMAIMDMMMLGVGAGFDTRGKEKVLIKNAVPYPTESYEYEECFNWLSTLFDADGMKEENHWREDIKSELHYISVHGKESRIWSIPDTREGWVKSVGLIINSYLKGEYSIIFDYSNIRKKGSPLRGFQGKASGPGPLVQLHSRIRQLMRKNVHKLITSRIIADLVNFIGVTVISGNIRRSAEILLFGANDEEAANLKDYDKYPDRVNWGWVSNNSVRAKVGNTDYEKYVENIKSNGEPGFFWQENARKYGRLIDPPLTNEDHVDGTNPCGEISLSGSAYGGVYHRMGEFYQIDPNDDFVSGGELCCLVETMLNRHDPNDYEDYQRTLKSAYLYAKTVTMARVHWKGTNTIQKQNRRLGISQTGQQQFIARHSTTKDGLEKLAQWCDKGYKYIKELDKEYSRDYFIVRKSRKRTTIKPSGTVSLLSGSTSGMHYPVSRIYIRRVTVAKTDPLLIKLFRDAGYTVVDSARNPTKSVVVEIPVRIEENIRTEREVPVEEQMEMAVFNQRWWADNQVSCTVKFDKETEGHKLTGLLKKFDKQLKGISFLPHDNTAYEQMPIEAISEEEYERRIKNLKVVDYTDYDANGSMDDTEKDIYCDSDKCMRM